MMEKGNKSLGSLTGLDKKYLYVQTIGCQMNVHDSEQIVALMEKEGYVCTKNVNQADLIILNTCSIREKAAQKVNSQLGRFRRLKEKNENLIIGVGGCLAQQMGERLITKVPDLDLVFGTHNIHQLPELIVEIERTGRKIVETTVHESTQSIGLLALPPIGRVTAFVTIMQGCNNFCAYCVVPYLRGREESRDIDDILYEISNLSDQGVKEITLLGQNVNSYARKRSGESGFVDLLHEIEKIEGIERIRFTTSHPKDISESLIASFAEMKKLCKHIHLPVQSGSDRILALMNRGYTRSEYLAKIEKLRKSCPDISITSDVIVGFPGETDGDFQETIDMMNEIRFDSLFSFKYSEREGTAALNMSGKVTEPLKLERLRVLQSLQEEHTLEKNRAMVGRQEKILVEGLSKNCREDVMGRTSTNKIVNFGGSIELVGEIVPVFIKEAYLHSLRGEML
jgi:tRNA-2-methylthio-N6-dimethylallyladenosine synthase